MSLCKLDKDVLMAMAALMECNLWAPTVDVSMVVDALRAARRKRPDGWLNRWLPQCWDVSLGALYLTLDRLQEHGLVTSKKVEPRDMPPKRVAARGGRGELVWQLTKAGHVLAQEIHNG